MYDLQKPAMDLRSLVSHASQGYAPIEISVTTSCRNLRHNIRFQANAPIAKRVAAKLGSPQVPHIILRHPDCNAKEREAIVYYAIRVRQACFRAYFAITEPQPLGFYVLRIRR